jgi:hypothetical protein
MSTCLSPPRLPIDPEDEPRILSARDLSWPVSISVPLTHKKKVVVSCVVPQSKLRCPLCGRRKDV